MNIILRGGNIQKIMKDKFKHFIRIKNYIEISDGLIYYKKRFYCTKDIKE